LDSVIGWPLDERVRDRFVAEMRGNPLALLELPRELTPAQLAGGFRLPDAPGLSGRIERSFRRRIEELPAETRGLLLVAAAEPVGDPTLLWRAAHILGFDLEAAAAAEVAGLVEFGTRVRFRHPLVRSAVYRAASLADRRSAHRALAEATDPDVDPDRRRPRRAAAWRRARWSGRICASAARPWRAPAARAACRRRRSTRRSAAAAPAGAARRTRTRCP
jgi:hypothetical protein